MNGSINKQKGFTLIEFIVYLAVTVVILVALGRVAFPLFSSNAKTWAIEEVSYNGDFVIDKVNSWVRKSDKLVGPSSGNSSSSLTLSINPGGGETVVQFREENGRIVMKKQGNSHFISSDEVEATEFNFENISYSETPGTLRTKVTFEFKSDNNQVTRQTFYGTANIRTND